MCPDALLAERTPTFRTAERRQLAHLLGDVLVAVARFRDPRLELEITRYRRSRFDALPYEPPQQSGHTAQRDLVIDDDVRERGSRHLRECGFFRVLHDRDSAATLDCRQAAVPSSSMPARTIPMARAP